MNLTRLSDVRTRERWKRVTVHAHRHHQPARQKSAEFRVLLCGCLPGSRWSWQGCSALRRAESLSSWPFPILADAGGSPACRGSRDDALSVSGSWSGPGTEKMEALWGKGHTGGTKVVSVYQERRFQTYFCCSWNGRIGCADRHILLIAPIVVIHRNPAFDRKVNYFARQQALFFRSLTSFSLIWPKKLNQFGHNAFFSHNKYPKTKKWQKVTSYCG